MSPAYAQADLLTKKTPPQTQQTHTQKRKKKVQDDQTQKNRLQDYRRSASLRKRESLHFGLSVT